MEVPGKVKRPAAAAGDWLFIEILLVPTDMADRLSLDNRGCGE
jgi:hypothetical protein